MSFQKLVIITLSTFWLPNCGKGGFTVPACEGIDCSDHGICGETIDGLAICICDDGYHAEELECIQNNRDDPCQGVTCSEHGTCVVVGGEPICNCDSGYHNRGATSCVIDT